MASQQPNAQNSRPPHGRSPEERRRRRRRKQLLRLAFAAIVLLLAALLIFGVVKLAGLIGGKTKAENKTEDASSVSVAASEETGESQETAISAVSEAESTAVTSTENTAADTASDGFTGTLLLVNNALPLDETYSCETAVADQTSGILLEKHAAAAYQSMAAAALQDGITLQLTSGLRTQEEQQAVYQQWIDRYTTAGKTAEQAAALADTICGASGCSEHLTGLAADILCDSYTEQDTGFDETEAYVWLQEHAAEYGFILRYPEDSQNLTGIVYEPWHWRFVGIENAKEIKASGLCLEAWLAKKTAGAA